MISNNSNSSSNNNSNLRLDDHAQGHVLEVQGEKIVELGDMGAVPKDVEGIDLLPVSTQVSTAVAAAVDETEVIQAVVMIAMEGKRYE